MSVQAYWNAYIPPHPDVEWEYPLDEIAEQVIQLRDIATSASATHRRLNTTVRNLGGENLELEVSGNIFRVLQFLSSHGIRNPFIIRADTQAELDAISEEIEHWHNRRDVDLELREAGE